MRTVNKFSEYERECRQMAEKAVRPEDKQALEMMAAAWARVADDTTLRVAASDKR